MSILKCPTCDKQLSKIDKQYKCVNNHSFDIAKQGYVNLLLNMSNKTHGDSREMLAARKRIQSKGYYHEISKKLNSIVKSLNLNNKNILDIGCGIGYYPNELFKVIPTASNVYGIDISKVAIKEAAKVNKDITYLVGTNNNLPFIDNSVDLIISVFSPIYIKECLRVLKKSGKLLVVSPNQNHLIELKEVIYETIIPKQEDRNELKDYQLQKIDTAFLKKQISVKDFDLYDIFLMTPHFFKSSINVKEAVKNIETISLTQDIIYDLYQKE